MNKRKAEIMLIDVGCNRIDGENVLFMYDLTHRNYGLEKKLAELQKYRRYKVSDVTGRKKRRTVIFLNDERIIICHEAINKVIEQIKSQNSVEHFSFSVIDNIWFNTDKIRELHKIKSKSRFLDERLKKLKEAGKVIEITRHGKKESVILLENGSAVVCSLSLKDIWDKVRGKRSLVS